MHWIGYESRYRLNRNPFATILPLSRTLFRPRTPIIEFDTRTQMIPTQGERDVARVVAGMRQHGNRLAESIRLDRIRRKFPGAYGVPTSISSWRRRKATFEPNRFDHRDAVHHPDSVAKIAGVICFTKVRQGRLRREGRLPSTIRKRWIRCRVLQPQAPLRGKVARHQICPCHRSRQNTATAHGVQPRR